MSGLGELIALVLAVVLLRFLVRLPAPRHRDWVRIRFRVPLRYRFPRLWWTAVTVGLLVGLWAVSCS